MQNACILNVILNEINTSLWITLDDPDVTVNVKGYRKKATRGWQLCIEWKDKSTTWERLCDMKKSYPVKMMNIQWWWGLVMNRHSLGGHPMS